MSTVVTSAPSAWEYFLRAQHWGTGSHGRAGRKEFWSFFAFGIPALLLFSLPFFAFFLQSVVLAMFDHRGLSYLGVGALLDPMGALVALYFTPGLVKLLIRRSHDLGVPGVFAGLVLLPYAGRFILLLAGLLPSQSGGNAYGAHPSEERATTAL